MLEYATQQFVHFLLFYYTNGLVAADRFDNPDNEFRVVRNLYRNVSVSRIILRQKRYPEEALQNSGIGGHNHRTHYKWGASAGNTNPFSLQYCCMVHITLIPFRIFKHRHHLVVLTTGPKPLPKRVLQTVRSSAPYFSSKYLLASLRVSSSRLCFFPFLPVPYIFPSIKSSSQDGTKPFSLLLFFYMQVASTTFLIFFFFIFHTTVKSKFLHPSLATRYTTFNVFPIHLNTLTIFGVHQ